MISKTGEAETITSHYLFALGSYRALYILNWIYRYYSEGFLDLIAVVAGCVQTVLYCDFFYLYITKGTCVHAQTALVAYFQDGLGKLAQKSSHFWIFDEARDDRVAVASAGPYENHLYIALDR